MILAQNSAGNGQCEQNIRIADDVFRRLTAAVRATSLRGRDMRALIEFRAGATLTLFV